MAKVKKAPAKKPKPKKPRAKKAAAAFAGELAAALAGKPAPIVTAGPGRPSDYTSELGEYIVGEMACGRTVSAICAQGTATLDDGRVLHLPHERTVRRWSLLNEEFRPLYARAREEQAHALFEQSIDIADDGRRDYVEKEKDGGVVVLVDHDHIQRAKLRVDVRKFAAAKLLPRVYGDRIKIDLPRDPLEDKSDDELRKHAADLIAQLAAAGIAVTGAGAYPSADYGYSEGTSEDAGEAG